METETINTDIFASRPIADSSPLQSVLCLAFVDFFAVTFALCAASALRNVLVSTPSLAMFETVVWALVAIMCSFALAGLYPGVSLNPVDEFRICTFSTTLGFLSLGAGTFFLHDLSQSRLVYILAYLFALVLVPLLRSFARTFFSKQGWWGMPVALLGFGPTGKLLLKTLRESPRLGLRPVVVFEDDSEQYLPTAESGFFQPLVNCADFVHNHRVRHAIVCMPESSREDLLDLLDRYRHCFRNIVIIPNLMGMSTLGTCAREIGGIIGLEVTHNLLSPSSQFLKRALDLSVTIAMAPVVLPLVALFAILVKLEDSGPAFFPNQRIGHDGKPFRVWKLRSMVTDGDRVIQAYLNQHPEERNHWEKTQKLKHDPRITRIGRIIRQSSIDELPQFWNVLIGEMSLVGPRPILESQIPLYGSSFSLYKQVRPGLTGLWQISGRNQLSFAERVKLDKYVVQNWSVWLDLYILARTAEAVLGREGAY